MEKYNPNLIESKWQKYWEKEKLSKAVDFSKKRKKYILDMFPYPSAEGLHVGHPEGYTATDIYSRYLRMKGYNVLHPMGWDSFGLPAENYAIKKGIHPKITTKKNIARFKKQIQMLGFSYDWEREINTADPDYYQWSQWFFLLMYRKGLAYRAKAPVNWCESCKTVLANEQVIDGKCERCKNKVTQKELEQWFFKITDYADRLLRDLADLDWSESLKAMQENWIGKSSGTIIKFPLNTRINADLEADQRGKNSRRKSAICQRESASVEVFTTRPDTLFGATYLVLAPEHPVVASLLNSQFLLRQTQDGEQGRTIISNSQKVKNYIRRTKEKTELERIEEEKVKTGVELKGLKAINPANKEEIPIFIADYILASYGTGAIMAVPAHDQRDYEFARRFNLPIRQVIAPTRMATDLDADKGGSKLTKAYTDEGVMINSGRFNGMDSEKAKEAITKFVNGKKSVQYKLRDWLISRQRYWGTPIPIIYCDKCGEVPVPEKDLPVNLPDDVDFRPKGKSPLAFSKRFQKVKCPQCGTQARREIDTMDGFVDNSWYYLRFCDPSNSKHFAQNSKLDYWMPIDLYIGGAEHAVGHLLYSRFFTKVLYDAGYIKFDEPFKKLVNQGLILAPDGRKMSKSLENVINPDDVVAEYGADTIRMYEMFMGPLEDTKPWDTKGIKGIRRFLERAWQLSTNYKFDTNIQIKQKIPSKLINQTIKKVTKDIENLRFNTAISAMMILVNDMSKNPADFSTSDFELLILILAPFAPHLSEELWRQLGYKKSIFLEEWPAYEEIKQEKTTIVIQINGKVRAKLIVKPNISEKSITNLALKDKTVQKWIANKKIKKTIYIPGKILSIVV